MASSSESRRLAILSCFHVVAAPFRFFSRYVKRIGNWRISGANFVVRAIFPFPAALFPFLCCNHMSVAKTYEALVNYLKFAVANV
jgi:hypothetical protein